MYKLRAGTAQPYTRGGSNRFFHGSFGTRSHFRVQSRDDSHIDVIGHKPITNKVVVGEKITDGYVEVSMT